MWIINNSDLMKHTIKTLLTITSRRASESISILLVDAILKALTSKYDFLKYVKIKTAGGYQDISVDMVLIDPEFEKVDQRAVGKVIESLVRIIVMDLREKAGLFFVKELKERLGENYISLLKNLGVDFELLQLEIDYSRSQQKRRVTHQVGSTGATEKKQQDVGILSYNWENVSTWRIQDNVCMLYDKSGRLLDKLHIDQIIENHVRAITESQETTQEKQKAQDFTEEHLQLLKLLYTRDLDMDEAKYYLKKTQPQIEFMIYELLDANYLKYVSEDMVTITQKGIDYLLSQEEKKLAAKMTP